MVKRSCFGVLWFIVLYFGACIVTGAIAGAIAGSRDPANAATVGAQAGQQAVETLRPYYLLGAAVLSVIGTWLSILPGTRKKPTDGQSV